MSRFLNFSKRLVQQKELFYQNKPLHVIKNRFLSSQKHKCWKCKAPQMNNDLFCPKCNILQNPVNDQNYFKVLSLDEKFDLELPELTQKYRKMQSFLHPDKFSNKSNEEKVISEKYSSLVNKAYSTLQNPLDRGIHILALNGIELDENVKLDEPEFLMEIMEFNEEIEEANTPEKLKELYNKNNKILKEYVENINNNFKAKNLEKAKYYVIKMKYYTSILKNINKILRERGIVD